MACEFFYKRKFSRISRYSNRFDNWLIHAEHFSLLPLEKVGEKRSQLDLIRSGKSRLIFFMLKLDLAS